MNKVDIEDLRLFTEEYVSTQQFRLETGGWWQTPLLASAPIDQRFDILPQMARWSHKHLAHLSNLGRFGPHNMLITPVGCTGRLGSLVTEADLGDNAVIDTDEACLLKVGRKCGKCIDACPVDALKAKNFERRRCWNRLIEKRNILHDFNNLSKATHVCGKCAALMPCSFINPVAKL